MFTQQTSTQFQQESKKENDNRQKCKAIFFSPPNKLLINIRTEERGTWRQNERDKNRERQIDKERKKRRQRKALK